MAWAFFQMLLRFAPERWWERGTWSRWPRRLRPSSSSLAAAGRPGSEAPGSLWLHSSSALCLLATPPAGSHCTCIRPALTTGSHSENKKKPSQTQQLAPPTWSACLCSRSTCPCAAAGCWAWRLRWCRRAASPPAWWARGRCRAGTWWSGRRWAAAGWSPGCRSPRRRCWMSACGDPWASLRTRPGWSHAPASQTLQGENTVIRCRAKAHKHP